MAAAILLAAVGEALASKGMKATAQTVTDQGAGAQIRAALTSGHVWIGIGLMCGYVLLYVYALGNADLSFAVPLSAASYLLGALASKFYLHEEVKPARWIGTAVITAGVLIVAIWGQSSGGSSSQKQGENGNTSPNASGRSPGQ